MIFDGIILIKRVSPSSAHAGVRVCADKPALAD